MNQSSVIVASVLLAFFVFITARGQLPAYLAVFLPSASNSASNASTSSNLDEFNPYSDLLQQLTKPPGAPSPGAGGGGF